MVRMKLRLLGSRLGHLDLISGVPSDLENMGKVGNLILALKALKRSGI